MDEGLVQIVLAVIALLGTVITIVAVPYLRSKTTKEQRENIYNIVKIAVFATEQLKKAGLIDIPKKEYVVQYLNKKGVKLTEADLDMFIESAVKELNIKQSDSNLKQE